MNTSDQQSNPRINPTTPPRLRAISSNELLQGKREVKIQHSGEVYRLLLTRNGKLILQK